MTLIRKKPKKAWDVIYRLDDISESNNFSQSEIDKVKLSKRLSRILTYVNTERCAEFRDIESDQKLNLENYLIQNKYLFRSTNLFKEPIYYRPLEPPKSNFEALMRGIRAFVTNILYGIMLVFKWMIFIVGAIGILLLVGTYPV